LVDYKVARLLPRPMHLLSSLAYAVERAVLSDNSGILIRDSIKLHL
jgi:hypothetical protein